MGIFLSSEVGCWLRLALVKTCQLSYTIGGKMGGVVMVVQGYRRKSPSIICVEGLR